MRLTLLIALLLLPLLCAQEAGSLWKTEIRAATALILAGQYQEAESHLRTALRLASNDGQSATTWNNLGSLYADLGRHSEAENAFRRSLRLWDKYEGDGSEAKANPLNSLGGLLVDQGRIKEAEQNISMSLALRRGNSDKLDVTPALNNLALVRLGQRRYRDAQALLSEALAVCQAADRLCTVARAPMHHNLALAQIGLGQDRAAIREFLASIEVGEAAFGGGHPKLGWTYFELASASMKLGNDALAESLFEKILAMQERFRLGPHPLTMSALERYSSLLTRQNRKAEAKRLRRQAKAMKTELAGLARPERQAVDWETLRASRAAGSKL